MHDYWCYHNSSSRYAQSRNPNVVPLVEGSPSEYGRLRAVSAWMRTKFEKRIYVHINGRFDRQFAMGELVGI